MTRRTGGTPAQVHSSSAEEQFERELEVFRIESEAAAQFFYAWLAVHATAEDDEAVGRMLNTAPFFWNTSVGALQTATFVTLGRIFDQKSKHNLDRLLKMAQENLDLFSKSALGLRKQGTTSKSLPAWIPDYVRTAHEPTPSDFRRLRAHVRKYRRVYENNYRDLRNKLFAHRGTSDRAAISAMFAKTNIRELQRLTVFLAALYEALWQLFMNGRRPTLRPRRYSVRRMRERASQDISSNAVHERIVHENMRFSDGRIARFPRRKGLISSLN